MKGYFELLEDDFNTLNSGAWREAYIAWSKLPEQDPFGIGDVNCGNGYTSCLPSLNEGKVFARIEHGVVADIIDGDILSYEEAINQGMIIEDAVEN